MGLDWGNWAELAVRWIHVIAGIAWIGSSFYFMWLDSHLRPPVPPRDGVSGELWSVHSGGFYQQHKFAVAPAEMPEQLHWFKWEAYSTWVSGVVLLALIFYLGAETNLVDRAKLDLQPWQAILIGLAAIVGGWLAYQGLCRSVLGKNLAVFAIVWLIVLAWIAFALTQIFADLGAFMHMGAIIGTVMAANVFFIIIPNQKKMVAQVRAGETPDAELGKQSKQRSVHNNYMTLPVLFIMISNHYPMIFGAPLNWLWLIALGVIGAAVRHFFNLKNAGLVRPGVLVMAAIAFVAVALLNEHVRRPAAVSGPVPTYQEIRRLVDRHCIMCHARAPSHRGIAVAPGGVTFDTEDDLRRHAHAIYDRAVTTHSMPLGNETGMTEAERARLGAWIKAGAKED
ncbi:urate hydroxylase PuuD [Sphingomonas sp. LB-2]|uniref:urate hydroxylase PuuD n=1 Tax=Sphingomonas caeni TaxID=2984949 RepID=UPI00222FCF10|nr:urate hydroxylase PuuD [Sphingomonas caeni]MCW3846640.1 urate hydroxylase PuuD [Sphingomonas caeni]